MNPQKHDGWISSVIRDEKSGKRFVMKEFDQEMSEVTNQILFEIFNQEHDCFVLPLIDDISNISFPFEKEKQVLLREYVDGYSLNDILSSTSYLSFEEKIIISLGICRSLIDIHIEGFEHRNISLANVIVSNKNYSRLCDALPLPLNENEVYDDIKSLAFVLYSIFTSKVTYYDDILDYNLLPYPLKEVIKDCISKDIYSSPNVFQIYKAVQKLSSMVSFPTLKLSNYVNSFSEISSKLNEIKNFDQIVLHFLSHRNLFHLFHYSSSFYTENPDHKHCLIILGFFFCQSKYVNDHINEGIEILEKSLTEGDSLGILMLSLCYFKGYGYKSDIKHSIELLKSNLPDKKNIFYPMFLYYIGKYQVDSNIEEALKCMKLSANENFVLAQSWLGVYYYDQNPDEAKKFLELAADQNDAAAKCHLSKKFIQNDIMIIKYLKEAARQMYIGAFDILGALFRIQKLYDISFHYLLIGAKHKSAFSQSELGYLYEIMEENEKAFYCYSLAAEQGYGIALNAIGFFFENGKSGNVDFSNAFEFYSRSAEQEFPLGKYNLGRCYFEGMGTEIDYNRAFSLFDEVCSTMEYFPPVFGYLYRCYYSGLGVEQDKNKAFLCAKIKADSNDAAFQYLMFSFFISKESDLIQKEEALAYLEKAANNNNAEAQYELGYEYNLKGEYEKAIHLFQLAAENGIKEAMLQLMSMHSRNIGNEYDKKKTFEIVSNFDDMYGHEYTADCYKFGIGTEIDFEKSFYHYLISAELGSARSHYEVYKVYKEIDEEKAFHYLELAAEGKFLPAQVELGTKYFCGGEYKKAFDIFKELAESGDDEAQMIIGHCYLNGLGVEKNEALALAYYEQSANNGNRDAQQKMFELCFARLILKKGYKIDR